MNKWIGSLALFFLTAQAYAQTTITKQFPLTKGETLSLDFDYPQLMRVSTWTGEEVLIQAAVSINGGTENDAFGLKAEQVNGGLHIINTLDMDRISDVYTVQEGDSAKRFPNKEAFQRYLLNHEGRSSYSSNKDIQITLEIKVPKDVSTTLRAVYGMVELAHIDAPIQVDAKYKGVDASLDERKVGKITLVTRYGRIYSNLGLTPVSNEERDFYTAITATPGSGPSYDIQSSYGNIYLRKAVR